MKRATEEEPTARQRQRVAMTAEEALTAAEAEGLLLVRTNANATGFRHVTNSSGQRFRLKASGLPSAYFATAEEAALAYSRHIGREAAEEEAARASHADMTAEEALAAAEAEGLPLVRSKANSSGFKYIARTNGQGSRFYIDSSRTAGQQMGAFATAEEAALTYSRHIGREAAEAKAARASHVDMTAEEALAAAEAEGLPLVRTNANATGFRHVATNHESSSGQRFRLKASGLPMAYFATAEEAALAYSRHVGREAAEAEAASCVPMTAEEALAAAEAEGLPLVRTDANATGFRHVATSNHESSSGQRFRLKASGLPMAFFATAEEAALAYSRHVGREAAEEEAARASHVDMTAEEALAAAEAEGLPLVRSAASSSGFKYVLRNASSKVRQYTLACAGRPKSSFVTVEEAALTYSRHIGREAAEAEAAGPARAPRVDMTAEEALAAAEAEGLPLLRSAANSTGFKYVLRTNEQGSRLYIDSSRTAGQQMGTFATAEEAALTYSRHIGREAAEAKAARASHADMTAEEALAAAEAEGLPLVRSAANSTGFTHVLQLLHTNGQGGRFHIDSRTAAQQMGTFATAEAAALAYSRHIGREAAEAEVAKSVQGQASVDIQLDPAQMKAFLELAGAKAKEERERAKEEKQAAKEEKEREMQAAREERERVKQAARAEREREKQAAREAREREKQAARDTAKVAQEAATAAQAARQELMAQRQRAMLQEAAERQRQRTAGSSRPGPSAPPCPMPPAAAAATPSVLHAEPGDGPTAALIKQVLRDRASAHLCLGVDFFAPRDVVRKRYLALVLRLHPDKLAHPRAAEAFAAVEAAFRRLCGA